MKIKHKHFKTDFISCMRKLRPVKVKSERILRTFLWFIQPNKCRLFINKSLNQPSAGNSVYPHMT